MKQSLTRRNTECYNNSVNSGSVVIVVVVVMVVVVVIVVEVVVEGEAGSLEEEEEVLQRLIIEIKTVLEQQERKETMERGMIIHGCLYRLNGDCLI